MAHVWDAATGALLAELRNDASEFPGLAFSADGRWLAASGGNDVRVFDARTWTQALVLPGPGIHGLSWDPGPRLLTGTASGDASIWTISRSRETSKPASRNSFTATPRKRQDVGCYDIYRLAMMLLCSGR